MPDCLPALPRGPGGPGFPRPLQTQAGSRRRGALNGCVRKTGPGQLAARAFRVFSLAGASLLLSGLLAAPVQAEPGVDPDFPVLVTNFRSISGGLYVSYNDTTPLYRSAGQHIEQSFTTGSHPPGYRVGKWEVLTRGSNRFDFSSWISQGATKVYTTVIDNYISPNCPSTADCILIMSPGNADKGRNLQPSTTYRIGFRPTRRTMKIYLSVRPERS